MSVFNKSIVSLALKELGETFKLTASNIRKIDINAINKNEMANAFMGIGDALLTASGHVSSVGEAALTNGNDLNLELRSYVNTAIGIVGGIAAASAFVAFAPASLAILTTGISLQIVGILGGLGAGKVLSFLESAGFTLVSKNVDFSNEEGNHLIVGTHLADTIGFFERR